MSLSQYQAETARPNPKSTINSYRSFGYNLSTAIADIIDNSISAKSKNVYLKFLWDGQDSIIMIQDDGIGMNLEQLIIAMTPGSKNPDEVREKNDLGRFGMGLKTASFSQCKRLTVVTKSKGGPLLKRCWDIDFINESEEWFLLDYISNENWIKIIDSQDSGTLIIWEKIDRLIGSADKNNEAVKDAFYTELSTVKEHLSLVFHKFIENNKLKIFTNDVELIPWNPFLLGLVPRPEMGQPETIDNVTITYYILPHMSSISHEDYEKSGGPLGWFQQQGFYVYRGDRLLVSGDWLGIEKKRDYSKLARISLNFTNENDFDWNLDIKKSTAIPPIALREDLKRIAKIAIKKSARIYNWRGIVQYGNEINRTTENIWVEETTREGIKKYKINKSHPVIKNFIDSKGKIGKISTVIKLIEENVPVEAILFNQSENPSFHELEKIPEIPSDELISLAVELYQIYIHQGITESLAKQQIMNSMPFSLFPLINEYLK